MTPDEMSAALQQAESVFEQRMTAALRVIDPVLGATATDRYMGKDLGGTSNEPNPRTGPGTLRKQTGRLARSLASTRGRIADTDGAGEGIARISTKGAVVTLTKGSRVPYARIHERGGMIGSDIRMPARPYLSPALDDTKDKAVQVVSDAAVEALQQIIRRAS